MKNKAGLVEKIRKRIKNPLIILTIITVIIATYISAVQISIGVNYFDVFTYLNIALFYAGMVPMDTSQLHSPPLIPFLTSLVFRAGFVSSNVIIIIDAIIFIFGVIGLYLLLKLRFNEIQSLCGCLIYISFPLIISWAASGSIDVPAVSFSIWAIYLMVMGVEKHSKYLYLALPLFALAVLTRYTAALLIFPMILYLAMGSALEKSLKTHLTHLLIAGALITPVVIYLYQKINYLYYLIVLMNSSIFNWRSIGRGDVAYNPDNLYYLHNLLNYMGVGPVKGSYYQLFSPNQAVPSILSYLTVVLVLCGLSIYSYSILKNKIEQVSQGDKKSLVQIFALFFLIILSLVSFFYLSYIITDILLFLTCLLSYKIFHHGKNSHLKIDLLFLCWFLTFFIMHSTIPMKVDRYFITVLPALAYFIILGLSVLIERYKLRINNKTWKTWGLYAVVGLIFLTSSTVTFMGHTPNTCLIKYIEPSTQWLEDYDPQCQEKVIFSDYSPAVSWSMKKMVIGGVLKDFKNTNEFSSMLTAAGAEYYIDALSEKKPVLKDYHVIKENGDIVIYQKNEDFES